MSAKYKDCPRWRGAMHYYIHWAKEHLYYIKNYSKEQPWISNRKKEAKKEFNKSLKEAIYYMKQQNKSKGLLERMREEGIVIKYPFDVKDLTLDELEKFLEESFYGKIANIINEIRDN